MTVRVIAKDTIRQINTQDQDNLILIDKPAGWTSFDVVKKVKNIGGFKKVGHAGTLDPFATGLLVLGTNRQTKSLANIAQNDKTYQARMEFGKTTDTFDVTGKVIGEQKKSNIDIAAIRKILPEYIGELEQVPPMYSAKKINGVRLYKLARKGHDIERKPHKITIFEIAELDHTGTELELRVRCSKGTYIRTLAHDIGAQSGYGAYLKNLRRIAIDGYYVHDALTVTEFERFWSSLN